MSKRPAHLDINQLAARIVAEATGEVEIVKKVKNAAAVARGKKRMEQLNEAKRKEFAMLGVSARNKAAPTKSAAKVN